MANAPFPIPRLADGVGIACFAEIVIVLDVHRDCYSRIGGNAATLLATIRDGGSISASDPVFEALLERGLVSLAPPGPVPWLALADLGSPEASAVEGGEPPLAPTINDLAIVIACVRSRVELRTRPLVKILNNLPRRFRNRPEVELVALARNFDRARRLAPFTPRCLPDTLAFLRHARSRGHEVNLVFGVKCYPFEAHCWAQSKGVVLTDPVDRVRRFQPILAV